MENAHRPPRSFTLARLPLRPTEAREHVWIIIVQIGNAPDTDVVEQCRGCGVVRHLTQHHCLVTARSSASVRYFRNGMPAIPNEACP